MSTRLRAVARETMDIVANGGYRAPSGRWVEVTVDPALTRLHLPGERLDRRGDRTPLIDVRNQTTLQGARELGGEPACLVFASAKNPGGGFLNGAKAQEEDVARASALYTCLTAAPAFYAFHREQGDLRYSDRVIYSPGVPVFRDDRGDLLDEPYRVAFLTSAAPNARAMGQTRRESLAELPELLHARAARVLDVAAAHGHRRLVLGAWGCGVFGNDPAMVAAAFATALAGPQPFDHVRFAVLDRHPGTPTFAAFRAALTG
ncbi:TIGR02452 family protein [Herbidospora sp. NEAU-GS84]|uniref:TIGR02452 family protein n=1 Tax=Herbidospora solisilvae TaxID=2696284 RepID=A0A7C9J011_9ACTN|nr:TIGR02452 family protein [Herbidospora solisilvae]NAS20285.1 TIGR02452 family protein [Herbidospora solisilvae]